MPLLILLLLSLTARATPIETSGAHVVRWNISLSNPTLRYYVDPALGANYLSWANSGFTIWDSVPEAYVTFAVAATEAEANIVVKGYSGISNSLVPMQASYGLNPDGTFQTCQVQVVIGSDAAATTPATQQYLQSGMIHEIGHCLGLQHSLQPGAVMSYRSQSPLSLAADDRFAVALLYPQDGETEYPLGCATVSGRRGGGGDRRALEAMLLLLVMALGTLAARRWRPRTAA